MASSQHLSKTSRNCGISYSKTLNMKTKFFLHKLKAYKYIWSEVRDRFKFMPPTNLSFDLISKANNSKTDLKFHPQK